MPTPQHHLDAAEKDIDLLAKLTELSDDNALGNAIRDPESPYFLDESERRHVFAFLIGYTHESRAAIKEIAEILTRRPA